MTLKEMLNHALMESGFAPKNDFSSSSQAESRQLSALANRELNSLQKDTWQELVRSYTFSMTTSKTYPLPSDFRQFTPDTAWTNSRRVDFPTNPETWAYYTARGVSSGLRQRMRLIDNNIEFLDPEDGQEVYIEYISNSPVRSAIDVPKTKFSSDDDTLILNDDLFIMGVIWRFQKLKGLDWKPAYTEYKQMYNRERGTNAGAQTISLGYDTWQGPFAPHAELWV